MILFENSHFLVIEKRAGWLAIPGRLGAADDTPCEWKYWETEKRLKLFVVHRLDREVSGVMIFAKSAEAHREGNLWFEHRLIQKTYEAFGEVAFEQESPSKEVQRWESRLLRGKKRAYEKPFGKESVTLAEFVKSADYQGKALELWKLSPLTGRSHQLRYEMMKHRRPVWGDVLYGSQKSFPREDTIALRAVRVAFNDKIDRARWDLPPHIETMDLTHYLFNQC